MEEKEEERPIQLEVSPLESASFLEIIFFV